MLYFFLLSQVIKHSSVYAFEVNNFHANNNDGDNDIKKIHIKGSSQTEVTW